MSENKEVKPHFYLGSTGNSEPYTSPSSGGGSNKVIPERNRQQHASHLSNQLNEIEHAQVALRQEAEQHDLQSSIGIQIEFESFPGLNLAVESLANDQQKIELLNVIQNDDKTFATIFVPDGKLSTIENKLQDYLSEKKDKNGKPRDNRKLIDAIQTFRTAALKALWTDDPDQLPLDPEEEIWWEVWLPIRGNREAIINDFTSLASTIGISVSEKALQFPECSVLLAQGNQTQFSQSSLLLNSISELRKAKETAGFFDSLTLEDQHNWSDELLSRLTQSQQSDQSPYVCILDTGVNIGHPLLNPFIQGSDQHTLDASWPGTDDNGHGTGMAGLTMWGDLTHSLETTQQIETNHFLESVKVLRQPNDHQGEHLGIITENGVSLPEIQSPHRTRIFSMALSAIDTRDRGRPSAWSATVDSLTVDYLGENLTPRLFILPSGNSKGNLSDMANYPDFNLLNDIHDPGQSFNALTVGAYTTKENITEDDCDEYTPLAPNGGISPYSSTSITWNQSSTPIKPEVVFEGGNVGIDNVSCISIASLSLLTTSNQLTDRLFTTFNATSAATALCSRFTAIIYAEYPDLWPETIRALTIHSAEWTEEMKQQFSKGSTERKKAQYRVRCVGFGVPNLKRALWSLNNSLSLIVEDRLQPFDKVKGKGIRTRDMHLHDLPWPKEALQQLGEAEVEMTVTLSYFIEPNPSSKILTGKYSYQSHSLRFDVKRSLESVDDFRKRINRQARDEEESTTSSPADPDWLLGSQFRHKGSIHKDIWKGNASDLAERGQIAVYPAMGWWRTRTALERYNKSARYSLIISIAVPEIDVDIYTEVLTQVTTKQPVEI